MLHSVLAGSVMDMPLDACIFEDVDEFVERGGTTTRRGGYVKVTQPGVERLTEAVAALQRVT